MLPDFLCIGAQKAGTTWLYVNIKHHPGVWMPPVKEIHYFNRQSRWPLIVQICHPKEFRMRDFVLGGLLRRLKQSKQLVLSHRLGKPSPHREAMPPEPKRQNLQWYLRLLLLPRNDAWYASLFSPGKGRVTGDITPYYANLEKDRVVRIHALMPDAKIIYLLRNPIHRLWSQAGMRFSKYGHSGLATTSEERVMEFLRRQSKSRLSDYLGNLETWESFYPKHQFYIGFFDQIVQNPHSFLQDIYRFLELDASEQHVPETAHEKRNPGQHPTIPDHFARYLARQYHEQIEQLHRRFNNRYTASWLDFAEQHLRDYEKSLLQSPKS